MRDPEGQSSLAARAYEAISAHCVRPLGVLAATTALAIPGHAQANTMPSPDGGVGLPMPTMNQNPSTQPSPDAGLVEVCEDDALASYSYAPNANTFKYIHSQGATNRVIKWRVKANAMPAECNGVVTRTEQVAEFIGATKNNMFFNTKLTVAAKGNGAVDKSVTQKTFHPYERGEWISGGVRIVATPVAGGKSKSAWHLLSKARA